MTAAPTPKTIAISRNASDDEIAAALRALRQGVVAAVAFPYPVKFRRSVEDSPAETGQRRQNSDAQQNETGEAVGAAICCENAAIKRGETVILPRGWRIDFRSEQQPDQPNTDRPPRRHDFILGWLSWPCTRQRY